MPLGNKQQKKSAKKSQLLEKNSDKESSEEEIMEKTKSQEKIANKPVILPKEFDGYSVSAETWLEDFENIGKINQWDEELKIQYLSVFLVGNAKTWFKRNHNQIKN